MVEQVHAHALDHELAAEQTDHHREADDQALHDRRQRQRAELTKGRGLADEDCERTCRFGGQERTL
jgi:hypothetical protein